MQVENGTEASAYEGTMNEIQLESECHEKQSR